MAYFENRCESKSDVAVSEPKSAGTEPCTCIRETLDESTKSQCFIRLQWWNAALADIDLAIAVTATTEFIFRITGKFLA